jgi:hypothetical protein
MSGVIYLLTFANGLRYVGQTKCLSRRLQRHRGAAVKGANVPVSRAWAEQGEPTCSIVYECDDQDLDLLERKAINEFGTLAPRGLNRNTGGKKGATACSETRALKSAANSRRYLDPAMRDLARESTLARFADAAERQRLSDSLRQRYEDPRARAVTAEAMRQVCARPQERARKSAASAAAWRNEAYRERMAAIKAQRLPKGSACAWAKVDEVAVRAIREARSAGASLRQLAAAYGITESSVSCIATRKSWKHVE